MPFTASDDETLCPEQQSWTSGIDQPSLDGHRVAAPRARYLYFRHMDDGLGGRSLQGARGPSGTDSLDVADI
jgi:hypothetical protein